MIASVFFYIFAVILLLSAAMVVTARNPVHSVLFLILGFFNAAGLFLIAGAEFLAMLLVIVYVGAVAVLFLFVVMMLDIDFAELREGFQRYLPVGATVGFVLLAELGIVLSGWHFAPQSVTLRMAPRIDGLHNTAQLGQMIYTDYAFLFQAAGVVLLIAMIGAIVLTLREPAERPLTVSRRQTIARQVARHPADTLAMVAAPLGAGVDTLGIYRPVVEEEEAVAEAEAVQADTHHGAGH